MKQHVWDQKKLVLIVKTFLLWSGQISGTWDSYKKKDNTGELLFQGNYVLLVFNDIDKTAVLFCLFVYVFHTKKTHQKKHTKKKIN